MDSRANADDPNDEQPRAAKKVRLVVGELAEDEEKEETTQKEEDKAAVAKIDTAVVASTWSPRQASRGGIKVRSLADGNFRGGDFVLDTDGNACTVSFLFKEGNKIYGLTAGHLAEVGEPLEVFAESTADNEGNYPTTQFGAVVSKDVSTDSLIFEVRHPYVVARVDLLKIFPESGLGGSALDLPDPDVNPTPPNESTEVVIYGAKCRGAHGVVAIACSNFRGAYSKVGDFGITSKTETGGSVSLGTESLTDSGDCGAIYLDVVTGHPIAMHHCLQNPNPGGTDERTKGYISFGIPRARIIAKHTLLGGHSEQGYQEQQRYSLSAATKQQTRDMATFKTKASTKIPPMEGTIQRPRQSPNIAKFKTRRIFIDEQGNHSNTAAGSEQSLGMRLLERGITAFSVCTYWDMKTKRTEYLSSNY